MAVQEIYKFVEDLLIGEIVSRTVFAKDGNVLLEQNGVLSAENIQKLQNWNIPGVFINDPDDDKVKSITVEPGAAATPEEPASNETVITLGSLEAEEPISWDDLAPANSEPIRPAEVLEKEMEERVKSRPPIERVPITPPAFVYDKAEVREAKRVVIEAHRQAVKETKKAIASISRRDNSSIGALRKMIVQLVDTGLSNKQVLGALTSLSHFDDHLLAHSVATTVYSILTGYMMGLAQNELYELAESALLHDIGMSRVPTAIWQKAGTLDQGEHLAIQRHTVAGADILHDIRGISFMAELVAYQHHERHDGSGYPKGRKGVGICEYARIVAMTDVYAAMTSRRPYRDRILGYEAMKYILSSSATLFDPNVVKAFLRCMSLYPIGSLVEISNGMEGVVVAANPLFPYRPLIKITRDGAGRETGDDGDVVDLLKEKSLGIIRQIASDGAGREMIWKSL
jgi:HD-GYP domain-containing protein (c-di-GMP phosphodiesterase class II)